MNTAFILWGMIAGACLMLAAVRVLMWVHDRGAPLKFWLALLSLAFFGVAVSISLTMAVSPEGGLAWALRGVQLAVFLAVLVQVRFLAHYLGSTREELAWLAIGGQGLALGLAVLPGTGAIREPARMWIGAAGLLFLLVYALDASLRFWRQGNKESRYRLQLAAACVLSLGTIGWLQGDFFRSGSGSSLLLMELAFFVFLAAMIRERSRDLSASARMAAEARQQREELAHVVRVVNLNELSGSIAHELNQPLAIILSNAQAAQRMLAHPAPDLDELRSILADIVHEDRRAGTVIQRLRALLKRGETILLPVSLNEVVGEVLHLVESNLGARGMEVSTELAPELPLVQGDSVQLQQVLLNLVLNAADAMSGNPPGKRRLYVSTSLTKGGVRLSVRDEGVGLPADIEGIFRPFYTTKAQGLGMGLAICRSIAGAHEGQLCAESHGDKGAAFHLELPARFETVTG